MNNFLSFKSYVSLEDAAKRISQVTGIDTAVSDLYQLALEAKIVLSINIRFPSVQAVLGGAEFILQGLNYEISALGSKKAFEQVQEQIDEYGELPKMDVKFTPYEDPIHNLKQENSGSHWLFTSNQVKFIRGTWDLVLTNSSLELINGYFHNIVSKNAPLYGGLYLQRGDQYASIVREIDDQSQFKEVILNRPFNGSLFQKYACMPEFSQFVIRTKELKRLISEITNQNNSETELKTKERENLIKIIGALLMVLKDEKVGEMSQTEIIEFIQNKKPERLSGLSERQLQKVFGEANTFFPKQIK